MKQFSRRDFLAGSTASAGLLAATSWTVGDEKPSQSPEEKKWWLTPIIVVLLGVGLLVTLTSTGAAPFIYSLF